MLFESLHDALDNAFDKPLTTLPIALQQRIEKEYFPISWDSLSADQRRKFAIAWDDEHDPAMESDRQYWWDFYQRKQNIKSQIEQWTTIATPTATDLAQQESRLETLKLELAAMKGQEQRHSVRAQHDRVAKKQPSFSKLEYIAYPKAMSTLSARLNATPEELAAWIFFGPEQGCLAAYLNANELDSPPKFYYGPGREGEFDYLSPLMSCWFSAVDIANFQPTERYITGEALIERWSKQQNIKPKAFILAKIRESRLMDMHPIYGGTEATFSGMGLFPPLETGLFALSHVEAIEREDFGYEESKANTQEVELIVGSPEWRKKNAQAAANAKHDLPGGSRNKQRKIREIWASGKYSSRDRCAEEECAALDMSFAAARNALKNT